MSFEASMLGFHCPRWKELPSIPLYMDQIIIVLDEALEPFAEENGHVITPTMINNYVKQKVITPPKAKRYERPQLATLIAVTLLKRVLSISEITGLMAMFDGMTTQEEAYDMFCAGLEDALHTAFSAGTRAIPCDGRQDEAVRAGRAAISALSGKLVAQSLIAARQAQRVHKEKPDKQRATDGQKP